MFYEDYFTRIEGTTNFRPEPYKRKISTDVNNEKAKNLYQDCFSNHVDFDNPHIDKLVYDNSENSTRYIQRDVLSAYFINHIYEVPKILKYDDEKEISFEKFIENLVENSYVENTNDVFSLGSNRLRFVVGNVGEGKSALIKKTISEISKKYRENTERNRIINIYMNFEDMYNYGEKPYPLKDDFYKKLYQIIQEKLYSIVDISLIISTCNINESPELVLKRVFSYLMEQNIQLLIFFDNIDFYHYYSAKYSYFEEYYSSQNEMINENIMWLYSLFSKKSKLGDQGLNIVFSVRKYVYDDIVSNSNGTDTEINTTKAYKIKLIDEDIVLGSRLKLLGEAIKIVLPRHQKIADDMELVHNELGVVLDISRYKIDPYREQKIDKSFLNDSEKIAKVKVKKDSPVRQISKIGQHGYRTLVQFFSSLNITYLDIELIDRFFKKQTSTLRLLYFTNIYEKYSQEENHFPNLFLNDCTVSKKSEFANAHQSHEHTYWLKYFILKLIVKEKIIKFQKIVDIFHILGGYDLHLIQHIVGSLGTANEFRCIEYDTAESCTIDNRKIVATDRGKYFYDITSDDTEHCFDIEYLQVVVEDKWLSVPNDILGTFYDATLNYGYVYMTGTEYINKSIDNVVSKAKSCMLFLNLLQSTYDIEIKERKPNLHTFFQSNELLPNLSRAQKKIINSTKGVIVAFKRDRDLERVEKLSSILESLKPQDHYSFLNKYYDDMTDLKKVR